MGQLLAYYKDFMKCVDNVLKNPKTKEESDKFKKIDKEKIWNAFKQWNGLNYDKDSFKSIEIKWDNFLKDMSYNSKLKYKEFALRKVKEDKEDLKIILKELK